MLVLAGRVRDCGIIQNSLRSLASNSSSQNTAIQQFYQKYVDAFVSGDMKTVATEYYKAPVSISVAVHQQTVMRTVFQEPLDVEQALTFQMEDLLARGYAGRSDMQPISVIPMTDIAKLIQTAGTRYHTSGAALEKIRASYVLERINDEVAEDGGAAGGACNSVEEEEKWFITSIHAEIIPIMEI